MTVGSIEGRSGVTVPEDEARAVLPVVSSLDLVIEEMLDRNEEARSASRLARDANREARTAAKMEAIGERREAADFALASGVVGGAVKLGSAAVSAGSALGSSPAGSGPAADETPAAESSAATSTEVAAPEPTSTEAPAADAASPAAPRSTSNAGDVVKTVEGAGSIATSVIDRFAAASRTDAEVADVHAETLGELANDRGEDRSSATAHIEKELDLYAQILEARRRAEDAATRA
jgi:hypothetical protein